MVAFLDSIREYQRIKVTLDSGHSFIIENPYINYDYLEYGTGTGAFDSVKFSKVLERYKCLGFKELKQRDDLYIFLTSESNILYVENTKDTVLIEKCFNNRNFPLDESECRRKRIPLKLVRNMEVLTTRELYNKQESNLKLVIITIFICIVLFYWCSHYEIIYKK